MGYYTFDKCAEDKVSQVGDLCNRLGMKEMECEPPSKEWLGEDSKISLVGYNPSNKLLLRVQCWPEWDYRTPEVRDFLKKVLEITGASQIYEERAKVSKLDMALFKD